VTTSASSNTTGAVAKADAAMEAWLNQRRAYRQLRHTKSADYWNDKVEANQSDLLIAAADRQLHQEYRTSRFLQPLSLLLRYLELYKFSRCLSQMS